MPKTFKDDNNYVIKMSGIADKIFRNLSKKLKNNKFEILTNIQDIRATTKLMFFNFCNKKAFNSLKQVFIIAQVFI